MPIKPPATGLSKIIVCLSPVSPLLACVLGDFAFDIHYNGGAKGGGRPQDVPSFFFPVHFVDISFSPPFTVSCYVSLLVGAARDMVLSYRHGFHAGGFSDVLKHAVLALCGASLNKQAATVVTNRQSRDPRLRPRLRAGGERWVYLDTMAGAARYDVSAMQARTRE